MDLNSLSFLLQSSLAYECSVCQLYFGTEEQLFSHHKVSHSKRVKVNLNPGLTLIEDEGYRINSSTPAEDGCRIPRQSSLEPEETSDDANVLQSNGDYVATLTNMKTEEGEPGTGQAASGHQIKKTSSELHSGFNQCGDDEEPVMKRVKTEQDESQSASTTEKGGEDNALEAANISESSNNLLVGSRTEVIDVGKYGYITESGFHPFNAEELKRFAIQIVALFKLDESPKSSQCNEGALDLNASNSLAAATNDATKTALTPSTSKSLPSANIPVDCVSRSDQSTDGVSQEAGFPITNHERSFDPNKPCYRCGQFGHFAWGCPNPRDRALAPQKRRRKRGRKRKQVTAAGTS